MTKNQQYLFYFIKGLICFFLIVASSCSSTLFSQDTDSTIYYVESKKGKAYEGIILEQESDSNSILLKDKRGRIYSIPTGDTVFTKRVPSFQQNKKRSYWPQQNHSALQHLTPNGLPVEKGSIHIQSVFGLANQFTFGITDRFSMTTGLAIPGFNSKRPELWMIPKYAFQVVDGINMSVGVVLSGTLGSRTELFTLPYTSITFGNVNYNFSIGFIPIFHEDGFADESIRTVGLTLRMGKRTYLKTDHYIIWYGREFDYSMNFVSLKHVWSRFSFDYGIAFERSEYSNYAIPFPIIKMSYSFRKRF